jgi:hypothetical protein
VHTFRAVLYTAKSDFFVVRGVAAACFRMTLALALKHVEDI